MKYCIGDTVVCINVEEQNLHSNFQAFRCDESEEPQLTIDIVEEPDNEHSNDSWSDHADGIGRNRCV